MTFAEYHERIEAARDREAEVARHEFEHRKRAEAALREQIARGQGVQFPAGSEGRLWSFEEWGTTNVNDISGHGWLTPPSPPNERR